METANSRNRQIPLRANGRSILVEVERIDALKAAEYLAVNTRNRSFKPVKIRQYARDMEMGKWSFCTDALAFYDDGVLANGQNRLRAIIESNTEQDLLVIRGLTLDDGQNIDVNTPRSATDVAHISGNDAVNRDILAVARVLEYGAAGVVAAAVGARQRLELYDRHGETVRWVMQHMPRNATNRNTCNAATRGAVGRALLAGVNPDKLARFCEVFISGFANGPSESAAVAIRNAMLEMRARGVSPIGHLVFRDTFLKTMNAIRYFAGGTPLTIIKGVREEAYPLRKHG